MSVLTSCKGGCCVWKYLARLSQRQCESSWTTTFYRAEMVQLSFEAQVDQVKTIWQRMLCHHPGWPLGRERSTVTPGVITLIWNMSCSMLMSHISSFPGIDARERDCCRLKPFYKNCLFGGVFMLNFCTKIISAWWFTTHLHGRHRCSQCEMMLMFIVFILKSQCAALAKVSGFLEISVNTGLQNCNPGSVMGKDVTL